MKGTKSGAVATKQSMNLIIKEEKQVNPVRTIAATLIAVLVLGVVGKFGILDRINAVTEAQQQLADSKNLYDALVNADKIYDDVVTEYNRYSFGAMTEEEKAVADRDQVLKLVEKYLISAANIENISLSGNSLSVQMNGITLQQASELLNSMQTDPLVAGVSVNTADTKDNANANGQAQSATITIVITLSDNQIAGGEQENE